MKKRTKITQDMVDKIIDLAHQNIRITEISRQLNIDRKSVYNYLHLYFPEREQQEHKEVTEEELSTVKAMYLDQSMTPTEISRVTGIEILRINKILDNYNIRKKQGGIMVEREFNVKMPEHIDDPLYYPERKVTPKRYTDRGKKYIDVSEVYGL